MIKHSSNHSLINHSTIFLLLSAILVSISRISSEEYNAIISSQTPLIRVQKALRVMTFNIWLSGRRVDKGLEKIAKHIKTIDADIVALQEVVNAEIVTNLTELLGKPWNAVHHASTYPDTAIFTKHSFVNGTKVKTITLFYSSNNPHAAAKSSLGMKIKFLVFFAHCILTVTGLCLIVASIVLQLRYASYRILDNQIPTPAATPGILLLSGCLCTILGYIGYFGNFGEYYSNTGAGNSEVVYGTGASIQLDTDTVVNFFSMHLNYQSYGPYAANNKQVTTAEQIMAGERNKYGNGRAQNIEELLKNERFKEFMNRTDKEPLIVAGDFNSPSHQDWTEETKRIHGGWVFEWPSTKLLTDVGFIDSYRHLYPDVKKDQGWTWSTVQNSSGWEWDYTIPEPQDRIDFIFYRGPEGFMPISSRHYNGDVPLKPIPDEWKNAYPSDHYAVISEFTYEHRSGEIDA